MEILDVLNKESVSGVHSGRASLSIQEVLLRMFEKVSQSLKYDSKNVLVHNTDHFTPLALRMRGNCFKQYNYSQINQMYYSTNKIYKEIYKACNYFVYNLHSTINLKFLYFSVFL